MLAIGRLICWFLICHAKKISCGAYVLILLALHWIVHQESAKVKVCWHCHSAHVRELKLAFLLWAHMQFHRATAADNIHTVFKSIGFMFCCVLSEKMLNWIFIFIDMFGLNFFWTIKNKDMISVYNVCASSPSGSLDRLCIHYGKNSGWLTLNVFVYLLKETSRSFIAFSGQQKQQLLNTIAKMLFSVIVEDQDYLYFSFIKDSGI